MLHRTRHLFIRQQTAVTILDAASRALRDVDKVQLVRPGSMADFEKWSIAASPALGWEPGQFEAAYRRNQSAVGDDTFEADAFAVAIHAYTANKHPNGWEPAARDMQIELDNNTPEHIRKSRSWPKTPAAFGNRIKRATPSLERKG